MPSRPTDRAQAAFKIRPGMTVAVRSGSEIRATLDAGDTLDGLPFTREMCEFCDRSFTVARSVNRIFVEGHGVRRIDGTVVLRDVRCDGAAHGGCQRMCLFLFKEAWLKPIAKRRETGFVEHESRPVTPSLALDDDLEPCQGQAVALLKATRPLPRTNIRQYVQDLSSGTLTHRQFLCMLLFVFNKRWDVQQPIWDLRPETLAPRELVRVLRFLIASNVNSQASVYTQSAAYHDNPCHEQRAKDPAAGRLGLEPGEIVEVRTRNEILATLNSKGRNRGLSFVGSMLKYCGGTFRVLARPGRAIDEKTGKLRDVRDAVLLENIVCDGISYQGCPRRCYWFWREAWLKRVGAA
ncbi:MAG: hypothetical protein M1335_06505 [Chloroflexi bacterium]|nr:hypothetical protein [Chloroflexota bacterium]